MKDGRKFDILTPKMKSPEPKDEYVKKEKIFPRWNIFQQRFVTNFIEIEGKCFQPINKRFSRTWLRGRLIIVMNTCTK